MHHRSLIFILLFGCISHQHVVNGQYPYTHQYQTEDYRMSPSSSSSSSQSLSSSSISGFHQTSSQLATSSSSPSAQYHVLPTAYTVHTHSTVDIPSSASNAEATYINQESDYETGDASEGAAGGYDGAAVPSTSSLVSVPQYHHHVNVGHHSVSSLHSPHLAEENYDQRESAIAHSDQIGYEPQPQAYPEPAAVAAGYPEHPQYSDSESSQASHEDPVESASNPHKDTTVGDLYYKRPMGGDYEEGSYPANADTEYKTGHYIKPKSSKYPKAPQHIHTEQIHQVSGHYPGYKHEDVASSGLIPSIEVPGLDKLIPNNSPVKFPALDFNFILSNLFGSKSPPHISVHAPEGASGLLTTLAGVGKPIGFQAPNLNIMGKNTKIQGFPLHELVKHGPKIIHGINVPKIDLSGQHASGLTLPHIDLPETESVGKSPKFSVLPPLGPSFHFLKHLPIPPIPRFKMPEIGPLKKLKIPKLDLTKIQNKAGLATSEDTIRPTYVVPPLSNSIGVPKPAYSTHPMAKAITIAKPDKLIIAYPLSKGPLSGHVVIEDYPYGRQQLGPNDDGGEPEIGCAELDKIIHAEPKPLISNSLYGQQKAH